MERDSGGLGIVVRRRRAYDEACSEPTMRVSALRADRSAFILLAELRIVEAEALLRLAMYDGAYYLAGYAVECGLKACIAKLTNLHDFPRSPEFAKECFTHSIEKLVKAAELTDHRNRDAAASVALEANWATVKSWRESSRYERRSRDQAEKLIAAITDENDGVLPWIKRHW
jgi:HEPN domain-containing protein